MVLVISDGFTPAACKAKENKGMALVLHHLRDVASRGHARLK